MFARVVILPETQLIRFGVGGYVRMGVFVMAVS